MARLTTQSRVQNHPFWGPHAPLSALTGAGLLVCASTRTAFALVSAGALVWVYGCTALVFCAAKAILPQQRGNTLRLFLTSFFGALYLCFLSLASPVLAMECTFLVLLAPVTCIASDLVGRVESLSLKDALVRSCVEALALGGVILALALIREPLGFGALSLPGGTGGILELSSGEDQPMFPLRIIGTSFGALILLGYGLAMFRYLRKQLTGGEDT